MKYMLFLTILILLSGCDDKSKKAELFAESVIGESLKDPYTAKFSSVAVHRVKQGSGYADLVHVCGLINAKNSLGAYTGNNHFVVSFLDKDEPEVIANQLERQGSHSAYWEKYCGGSHK